MGQYLGINYDKKMKVGNTTIYVVYPKITEDELQRRLDHVGHVCSMIASSVYNRDIEVTVRRKKV